MKNKKLSLRKITVTKLDNLHNIQAGAPVCPTLPHESCTTKPFEDEDFTENGTLIGPGFI